MFVVIVEYADGDSFGRQFASEREARAWFNTQADGASVCTLYGPDDAVIVESAFPVLMVA